MSSEQFLSLYGIEDGVPVDEDAPFATLPKRTELLNQLSDGESFDLLILGGGLTGAVLAREAALKGIKVLLLEGPYFGDGALSWDVRIACQLHKRALTLFSARRVFKSLTDKIAPHLVTPLSSNFQTVSGVVAKIIKRIVPLAQVDERLLIRESILAARQEGAVILSSVTAEYLEAESAESGCYQVEFKDDLSEKRYRARVGGVVIDPTHGRLPPSRLGTFVVPLSAKTGELKSTGVQLVYRAIPRSAKSGLSFVSFELSDRSFLVVKRTGVQTIEVTVLWANLELNDEQLARVVDEAINESGWIAQSEVSKRRVSGVWSDRYGITQTKGVFRCSHRGAWDAFRSVETILKALVRLLPDYLEDQSLVLSPLPGSERNCEVDAFRALARAQGISEQTIERVVLRWRGRVRYLSELANGLIEFVPGVLRSEVELAVISDQVTSFDDLVFGALQLERHPDWQNSLEKLRGRFAGFFGGGGD